METITTNGQIFEAVTCRFCGAKSSDKAAMEAHEGRHELRLAYIAGMKHDPTFRGHWLGDAIRPGRGRPRKDGTPTKGRPHKDATPARPRDRYCRQLREEADEECGRKVVARNMCRWHYQRMYRKSTAEPSFNAGDRGPKYWQEVDG